MNVHVADHTDILVHQNLDSLNSRYQMTFLQLLRIGIIDAENMSILHDKEILQKNWIKKVLWIIGVWDTCI